MPAGMVFIARRLAFCKGRVKIGWETFVAFFQEVGRSWGRMLVES